MAKGIALLRKKEDSYNKTEDEYLLFPSQEDFLRWNNRWMNPFEDVKPDFSVIHRYSYDPEKYYLIGEMGKVDPRVIEMLQL